MNLLVLLLLLATSPIVLHGGQKEDAIHEFFGTQHLQIVPLEGGMDSPVWRVESAEGQHVVRLLNPSRPLHEILKEIWVTELVSDQGIGPELVKISLVNRALLLEYIPGSDLKKNSQKKVPLTKVAESIAKLQASLPIEPYSLIESCYRDIKKQHQIIPYELKMAMKKVKSIETEIDTFGSSPVLCHGDYHLGQVILPDNSNHIKVIDWTNSTIGDRFYDLAKLSLPFNDQERDLILYSYLRRNPTQKEKRHFFLSRKLVLMTIVLNRLSRSDSIAKVENDIPYLDPEAFSSKENLRKSAWNALREFLAL